MSTADIESSQKPQTRRQAGYPATTRRFDLLATALAAWVVIGIFVDVNAHNHGQVDDTFFTPWHFLLYSGVLANGVLFGMVQYRNVGRGYAWAKAVPRGYMLSFVGVLIFALAGGFDFVWHSLFGFEVNLEALLSPAHLLLATGGMLFVLGPLRAQWGRRTANGWRDLFPALASATFALSLLTLFTQFANLITQVDSVTGRFPPGGSRSLWDSAIASAVLIPAVLISATLLLLVRRWSLPRGAVTFVLVVNALLMFYLRLEYIREEWPVLLAAVIAGIIGDGLVAWRQPSIQRVGALRLFAFAVPLTYFLSLFLILLLTSGVWWSIHMWLGTVVMAGVTGFGLSYLVAPPAVPDA
ncbi:MAG: hypothetical protein CL610_26155 [Anaerolineaceae bacterium]|nr:hypothetical protein [Anaerolineaceae bacterium]